jgi:hypothetical protein
MRDLLTLAILVLAASPIDAAPCTAATAACSEWIQLADAPSRTLIYRSHALGTPNPDITRALIVVHGASRDADNYFRSMLAAAFLAGALDDTIIIAPRFASSEADSTCHDKLAENELNWTCKGPDRWSYGGPGAGKAQGSTTTFDLIDDILRQLTRKEIFPNLKAIVLAGHSAGGMFVTRYQLANTMHEKLGVPLTYIVANPSSYVYFEARRPTSLAYPVTAASPGYMPEPPKEAFAAFSDRQYCTNFDSWPYGLHERTGYAARLPDETLKKQLAARPATYLLGQLDILPLGGMDLTCAAMAQGPTRMARGIAYGKYVNEKLGAHHQTVTVPLCGHNGRCMFTADPVLPLIFPKAAARQ